MKHASTKTVRLLTSPLAPACAGAVSATADCARATMKEGDMPISSALRRGWSARGRSGRRRAAELRMHDGAVAGEDAGLHDLVSRVDLQRLLLGVDDQGDVREQVAGVERARVDRQAARN